MKVIYEGIDERIKRLKHEADVTGVKIKAIHLTINEANSLEKEMQEKYGCAHLDVLSGVVTGKEYMGVKLIVGGDS